MIPGPELIYECPYCSKAVFRKSLRSGNTVGAELFSDGKQIAPMLPEFPAIVKCKGCQKFYWLDNSNQKGVYDRDADKKIDLRSDRANFLSVCEYQEAIDAQVYRNDEELLYLRMHLWWTFNDENREGTGVDFSDEDIGIYEANCLKLIEIPDKNDVNAKIRTAELHRNIGNFAECREILKTINNPEVNWVVKKLLKECKKNNRRVVQLT